MSNLRADLIASLGQLDHPETVDGAKRRLIELSRDKEWTRRFFAGDENANVEYERLVHIACGSPVPPKAPQTAEEMRRAAELKYDCAIPHEVLRAIEEQKAREVRR